MKIGIVTIYSNIILTVKQDFLATPFLFALSSEFKSAIPNII
jgi:hypothetical protein